MSALLEVSDLTVTFPTRFGDVTAIEDISLRVDAGEIHGLVGESGAGKSTIGAAIMGLLQSPGYIASGRLTLGDTDLRAITPEHYHRLRGDQISMIFQDPQTSLNPLLTIAEQLIETIRQHSDLSAEAAHERAVALLEETGLSQARARLHDYPHQFSGGMRQRVVIALALCTNPALIIADEPTTALDVSVQQHILTLIRKLAKERGVGFLLITHDIGVISEICDRVTVLRAGRVVESGATQQVLQHPSAHYTQALMAAVPRLETRLHRFKNILAAESPPTEHAAAPGSVPPVPVPDASAAFASQWLLSGASSPAPTQGALSPPLLSVQHLDVTFSGASGWLSPKTELKALSDISFSLHSGEVLGVVGESGSGKSTLAKAIVGLVDPSAGQLHFAGEPLPAGRLRHRSHPARRRIQMVFQDPYSSLNNRLRVEDIIAEPIRFYRLAQTPAQTRKLVASVLDLVEMPQRAMLQYPHQFSGGQRQRIAVARALVARPEFLICDEPTSALDVSIQAQILNLLKDLQAAFGLSILFISHNLAVIRQMSDRLLVLKNGDLIETADTDAFFSAPQHPYSQQLLRETPSLAHISAG